MSDWDEVSDRQEREVVLAEVTGEHVWVTTCTFGLSREQLRRDGEIDLDASTLMEVSDPWCLRCAAKIEESILDAPCPGAAPPGE